MKSSASDICRDSADKLEQGLPPRKMRRGSRRRTPSVTFWFYSGCLLFGTFFVLILGYQWYRAGLDGEVEVSWKQTDQPLKVQTDKVTEPDQNKGDSSPKQGGNGNETSAGTVRTSNPSEAVTTDKSQTPSVPSSGQTPPAPQQKPPVRKTTVTQQRTATQQKTQRTYHRHVVQKGETLYQLSRMYYGHVHGVESIARYNGLDPEQQLKLGQVITIPGVYR